MKKTFAFAALATLMGAPAFAAAEPALAEVDANADGFVTIEELQANDLDVTAESFADWDVNGDAKLSEAEYTAWQKASSEDWGKPTATPAPEADAAGDDAAETADEADDEMEER
jgi:hypothetical protein